MTVEHEDARVLVVDSTPERCREFAVALSCCATVYGRLISGTVHRFDAGSTRWPQSISPESIPELWVCFQHLGDLALRGGLAADVTIYYGATGPQDDRYWGDDAERRGDYPRSPPGCQTERVGYLIQRCVGLTGQGCPSSDEARELVSWAAAIRRREQAPLPLLLQLDEGAGIGDDALLTLNILCQGYLAALAAASDEAPPEAMQALEVMGWDDFMNNDGLEVLSGDLQKACADAKKPKWWIEGLGGNLPDLDDSRMGDDARRGVQKLLDVLATAQESGNTSTDVAPGVVAEAFLGLWAHLGGTAS